MELRDTAIRRLVLLAVFAITGCAPSQPTGKVVATVPAKGVLLYQRKPLPFYSVVVAPENERSAIGTSDEEGHFVLGTNRPNDGAVPGKHRVAINYVGDPEDDPTSKGLVKIGTMPKPPKLKIDKKYQNPTTSGIWIEIPPKGDESIEIDLK